MLLFFDRDRERERDRVWLARIRQLDGDRFSIETRRREFDAILASNGTSNTGSIREDRTSRRSRCEENLRGYACFWIEAIKYILKKINTTCPSERVIFCVILRVVLCTLKLLSTYHIRYTVRYTLWYILYNVTLWFWYRNRAVSLDLSKSRPFNTTSYSDKNIYKSLFWFPLWTFASTR